MAAFSMDNFPIKVESIKGKGRGLVAIKDLNAGDTVLAEEPYAFCLTRSYDGNKCDYCFTEKEKLLRCSQCKHQKYCSISCQKSAWYSHKAECKNLPKLTTNTFKGLLLPEMILLYARLLRKTQTEKKEDRQQARTDGFPQSINDLIDHYEHLDEEEKAKYEVHRAVLQSFLGKKIEKQEFDHLASRVECNALRICGPVIEDLGPGIYLKASLINNSCNFNSVTVYTGTTLNVRAVMTVMKGEEFTLAYTDVFQPTHVRRKILRQQYSFTCNCPRCEHKELDAELLSILCETCKGHVLRKEDKKFMECSACGQLPSQRHESTVLAIEAESESFVEVRKAKPITCDEDTFKYALELAGRQKYCLHPLHYLRAKTCDRVHYIGCNLNKFRDILPFIEEVKSSYEYVYPAYPFLIGIYCGKLAMVYESVGRFEEARKCYVQALELLKITHDQSHYLYQQVTQMHDRCVNLLRAQSILGGAHW